MMAAAVPRCGGRRGWRSTGGAKVPSLLQGLAACAACDYGYYRGLGLLLTLFALKPLVTALCLGSGASGGLFTPTLSTGAVLGSAGHRLEPGVAGVPSGAFAMVGAAMQAPLSGLALVLELTHSGFGLMVPMIAAAIATIVAFHVDGYSIYSARLPAFAPDSARPDSGTDRQR